MSKRNNQKLKELENSIREQGSKLVSLERQLLDEGMTMKEYTDTITGLLGARAELIEQYNKILLKQGMIVESDHNKGKILHSVNEISSLLNKLSEVMKDYKS